MNTTRLDGNRVQNFIDGKEIDQALSCPLSLDLFRVPVRIEGDAHRIYEANAIRTWLRLNTSDPFTRRPVAGKALILDPYVNAKVKALRRAGARFQALAGNTRDSAARTIQAAWWDYRASSAGIPSLSLDVPNTRGSRAQQEAQVASSRAISRAALARSHAFFTRQRPVAAQCLKSNTALSMREVRAKDGLRALIYAPVEQSNVRDVKKSWQKWIKQTRSDRLNLSSLLLEPVGTGCAAACSALDILIQGKRIEEINFLSTRVRLKRSTQEGLTLGQSFGPYKRYSGDLVAGAPEGLGMARFRKSFFTAGGRKRYFGAWMSGEPHGHGLLLFDDGSTYEGEWVRGQRHGYGVLSDSARDYTYEGDWVDDRKHGFGSESRREGTYIGAFHRGTRHGGGTFRGRNGHVYEGDWEYGERHGFGRLTHIDGTWVDAVWRYGDPTPGTVVSEP